MKATHIFHGRYPVAVTDHPTHPRLAKITYVGPEVPSNRRRGETRHASRIDLNGKPTLEPIKPQEK